MKTNTAICISTFNRQEQLRKTLAHVLLNQPANSEIFIVEDFSDNISGIAHYTFKERVGIPSVKNKCFELAYNSGAEHVFLLDDDTYPLLPEAFTRYIYSSYNHLCYTFYKNPMAVLPDCKYHYLANGCMMYFKRICLDIVGGFDPVFGLGKYEHVNLSWRIHNAKLTPYQYMDIRDGEGLFYCMDEKNEIERSFHHNLDADLLAINTPLFHKLKTESYYIDFRG